MCRWKLVLGCLLLVMASISCKPDNPKQPVATGQAPALAGWEFRDPHDASVADVVTAQDGSYALDPNWQIASIHYLYQWWGLGEPVFDYQVLESDGDHFRRAAEIVPVETVQAFLKSIDQLYPSQLLVGGNGWTDDYPSWAIEIVGRDGRRVQLFSASTGNEGDGPWNVLDNGRLYAQYDGSLAEPLSKLFSSKRGDPAAAFVPGGRQPDTVVFGTRNFPAQMVYGFNGLLPIADGFGYQTNVVSGTLTGFVQGRSSIGGRGGMVIGSVIGLTRVELTQANGAQLPCVIEPIDTKDVAGAVWRFTCTPGSAVAGQPYRFSITVELGTDKGEHLTTTGEIWGKWSAQHPDGLYSPLSYEVQTALAANEAARDVLTEAVPVVALYQAETGPATPLTGTLMGEVVLAGSTTLNGTVLRYTVGTPFTIKDGQLIRWDLTRVALRKMLQEIEPLPLTKRILQAVPTTQLNMWYAEAGDDSKVFPSVTPTISGQASQYSVDLSACGQLSARQLPRADEPLQAFGFNNGWAFYQADFVLIDGQAVVNALDLRPGQDDRDGVSALLLPDVFKMEGHRPFDRVWASDGFMAKGRALHLYLPENMTSAERAVYDKVARSLPGQIDQQYDSWWDVSDVTLVVNTAGQLEVAACR